MTSQFLTVHHVDKMIGTVGQVLMFFPYRTQEWSSLTLEIQELIASHQSVWPSSKSLQIINAGEDVERREPSYTVGEKANR